MPDVPGDPPLTPQHDAVRRLLADARHTGPTPPEVVARLDETLASLVVERGARPLEPEVPAPADLAARRRRVAGIGLLAAAAVVVAGVGLGQVLPRGGSDAGSADSSSADSSSADSGTGLERSAEGPADGSAGADAGEGAGVGPESLKSAAPRVPVPTLTSSDPDLADQVERLRSQAVGSRLGATDVSAPCAGPADDGGRRVTAEVDGLPGVVVFRRPAGDTQRVEVYTCDAAVPVRTLTIPAP